MIIVVDKNSDKLIVDCDGEYRNGQEYDIKNPKQISEVLEIVFEAVKPSEVTLLEFNEDTCRTVYES